MFVFLPLKSSFQINAKCVRDHIHVSRCHFQGLFPKVVFQFPNENKRLEGHSMGEAKWRLAVLPSFSPSLNWLAGWDQRSRDVESFAEVVPSSKSSFQIRAKTVLGLRAHDRRSRFHFQCLIFLKINSQTRVGLKVYKSIAWKMNKEDLLYYLRIPQHWID